MKKGTKFKLDRQLKAVRANYLKFTRQGYHTRAIYLRKYAKTHAALLKEVRA